jgi:hypothetical protein
MLDLKPLLSAFLILFTMPVQAADRGQFSVEQQIDEVVTRLTGVMDTSAQAVANPKAANVRMTTCKIALKDAPSEANTVYLYQEQALSSKLTSPYRQRFLQISPRPFSQTVRSLSFRPANSKAWIGLCNQPEASRIVELKDLGKPVCSVFLKRSGNDYAGRTPIDGCPANVRGAVRITNQITLHPSGMDTWDRGYGSDGKQVWGAKTESYQFKKSTALP